MLSTRTRLFAAMVFVVFLAGCTLPGAAPTEFKPEYSRKPPVADWSAMKTKLTTPPQAPASNANDPFAVDLRVADPSGVDLSASGDVLMNYASFDTHTKWPANMPAGYDPKQILELGKNPGLGVRSLHQEGITGKGVHVAFLDQTLLVDHDEYKDQIRKYGEIGRVDGMAAMHGAAVASILAGKSVGVAPDVSITYYAVQVASSRNPGKRTFVYLAQAIHQILDDNAKLPVRDRIRAIGMSIGWGESEEGYAEIEQAVARAKKEGVFILSTSVDRHYALKFHGLNRDPLADPEDYRSYRVGSWVVSQVTTNPSVLDGRILMPMDSRTTAAPIGTSDYVFYRAGGWSWVVPYLLGVYAMALQVEPDLTPDQFYLGALKTAWSHEYSEGGQTYKLGAILNPAALIRHLQ